MGFFKKIKEKKNLEIVKEELKKIELLREEAHKNGRFSMFDLGIINEDMDYETIVTMSTILNGWESSCNIPYTLGESLMQLTKDNTVMIHRTNLGLETKKEGLDYNENLVDIMGNGLINQGHINAGGGGAIINGTPSLTLTMTPLTGLAGFINLIETYKNNDTVIVIAFPKDLVDKDGKLVRGHDYSEIYDLDGNVPRVKPEFNFGAIIKKDNSLDEFYTRDEILGMGKTISK